MSDEQTMKLTLEVREGALRTQPTFAEGAHVMVTPAIDEGYWLFRVRVSETQAIVGFPKFMTIGIGFAKEEDWNTNLPYSCSAREIFDHIAHNKGDDAIPDSVCLEAIAMVQDAARRVMDGPDE